MGSAMDAEIWRCMETIEFDFGRNRFTVKQAGLLFAYEIGADDGKYVYVIALSENCGTVIFYIPDDLMELVFDRARELGIPFEKYIADLIEVMGIMQEKEEHHE